MSYDATKPPKGYSPNPAIQQVLGYTHQQTGKEPGVDKAMGAELAITASDFEKEVLQSDVPVLVDFWATWCRPCIAIGPFVEEIAAEMEGKAKVYKVDVDSNGELAGQYGVMSIPNLLVFKGGQVVDNMVGAGAKEDIKALIEKHV